MAALTRIRRAALRALAPALALALAGCTNPFAPAQPVPPSSGGIVEDYSTTARLLSTLVAAVQAKGPAGRQAWVNAMADSTGPGTRAFYAFADPQVLSKWNLNAPVDAPDPWDLELEKLFYDKFTGLFPYDYAMSFDPDLTSPSDEIDDVAGTALLHRKYYVAAGAPSGSIWIAIGYVDLYLVKYDGRWWVTRWQDRLDPQVGVDPTDPQNVTLGWRRFESVSSTG